MRVLPPLYQGLYFVVGLLLALIVDETAVALSVPVVLLTPVAVVVAFNAFYNVMQARAGLGVADERMQSLVRSAMAWGFVAFGVVLGVGAAGVDDPTYLDALQAGVLFVVGYVSLARLRQRYSAPA